MSRALQFVLFESGAATWDALVAALQRARFTVESRGATSALLKAGGNELSLSLSTAPTVKLEAREIADSYGKSRPDRERLAAADARVEIGWDPAHSGRIVDDLIRVAEVVEHVTHGVVFDTQTSRFLTAPRKS